MATHSSILAWRISWTKELVSYGPLGCKESEATVATEHACMHLFIWLYRVPAAARRIFNCSNLSCSTWGLVP